MRTSRFLLLCALALALLFAPVRAQNDPAVCNKTNAAVYQAATTVTLPASCPGLDNFQSYCKCNDSSFWQVAKWKLLLTTTGIFNANGYQGSYAAAIQYSPPKPFNYGQVTRMQCCRACSMSNKAAAPNTTTCAWWLHYVPPTALTASTCSSNQTELASKCGYCVLFPQGANPPACETTTCVKSNSVQYNQLANYYSSVGRGCVSGCNDPHFVGAQGTRFDFNGVPDKSFCLVTDPAFQVNMRMKGYYDKRTVGASLLRKGMAVRTWIKDLAFLWIDPATGLRHALKMSARDGKSEKRDDGFLAGIEVDGVQLDRMRLGDALELDGGLKIKFVAYGKQGGGYFDVDEYEVYVGNFLAAEVQLRAAHPLLQTATDAMVHINVRFTRLAHSESTHGVLGQTFQTHRVRRALDFSTLSRLMGKDIAADGESGRGFLDGAPEDYQTTNVMSADCKYSAFGGQRLPGHVFSGLW